MELGALGGWFVVETLIAGAKNMRNVGMGGGGISRRVIVGPDHAPYQPGKARDWSGCQLVHFLCLDGIWSGKYRT